MPGCTTAKMILPDDLWCTVLEMTEVVTLARCGKVSSFFHLAAEQLLSAHESKIKPLFCSMDRAVRVERLGAANVEYDILLHWKSFCRAIELGCLFRLTNLDLSYFKLDENNLKEFANALCASTVSLPFLQTFVSRNANVDSEASLSEFVIALMCSDALPCLTQVDVSNNFVSIQELTTDKFMSVRSRRRLRILDLSFNKLTRTSLPFILQFCLLVHLNLERNRLGDAGMQDFCSSLESDRGLVRRLETLRLTHNQIGAKGLGAWTSLVKTTRRPILPKLKILNLSENNIGKGANEFFASLVVFPNALPFLKRLCFDCCELQDDCFARMESCCAEANLDRSVVLETLSITRNPEIVKCGAYGLRFLALVIEQERLPFLKNINVDCVDQHQFLNVCVKHSVRLNFTVGGLLRP